MSPTRRNLMSPTRRNLIKAAGGVAVALTALPAPTPAIPAPPAPDPSHAMLGYLMAYDSGREAVVSGAFELWTTATGCAFVMDDGQGGERRQIVFDQPDVVWAFTCMARLMQQQGTYHPRDDA